MFALYRLTHKTCILGRTGFLGSPISMQYGIKGCRTPDCESTNHAPYDIKYNGHLCFSTCAHKINGWKPVLKSKNCKNNALLLYILVFLVYWLQYRVALRLLNFYSNNTIKCPWNVWGFLDSDTYRGRTHAFVKFKALEDWRVQKSLLTY